MTCLTDEISLPVIFEFFKTPFYAINIYRYFRYVSILVVKCIIRENECQTLTRCPAILGVTVFLLIIEIFHIYEGMIILHIFNED